MAASAHVMMATAAPVLPPEPDPPQVAAVEADESAMLLDTCQFRSFQPPSARRMASQLAMEVDTPRYTSVSTSATA